MKKLRLPSRTTIIAVGTFMILSILLGALILSIQTNQDVRGRASSGSDPYDECVIQCREDVPPQEVPDCIDDLCKNLKPTGMQLQEEQASCSSDADCAPSRHCQNNKCIGRRDLNRTVCRSHQDCTTMELCRIISGNTGFCVPKPAYR